LLDNETYFSGFIEHCQATRFIKRGQCSVCFDGA